VAPAPVLALLFWPPMPGPLIDRAQVRRIAVLANLEVSEAEEETLATELSKILGYIEKLSAVDVASVPATAAPAAEGVLRKDEHIPSLTAEQALSNAPARVLTAFSVPKILSNESMKDPE
jgi:aspartyl-tRNA(Asn)/glutamyl-tRNA(Gln) amidotransferase subunit C